MKTFLILITLLINLNGAGLKKSGNFVIDKTNNLMWQDSKDNITMLGSQKEAVKYCKSLNQSGYTDWKLPSVEEYKTIIDKTRRDEVMINRAFKYILPEGYWTKDRTWRNFGVWGFYIYFKSGAAYYENRTYPKFFRCVRKIKNDK